MRGVVFEYRVGNLRNQLLHITQVLGATDQSTIDRITELEITKRKLTSNVLGKLLVQRLRGFVQEADIEPLGLLAEALLGRLQQNGHQRVILTNQATEIDTRVLLFVGTAVGRA